LNKVKKIAIAFKKTQGILESFKNKLNPLSDLLKYCP